MKCRRGFEQLRQSINEYESSLLLQSGEVQALPNVSPFFQGGLGVDEQRNAPLRV